MTIKISGIELELPDGCTVEVADEGKKIIVKAAGATEVHHHHHHAAPLQVWPWWQSPNWPYQQTIVEPYYGGLGATPLAGNGSTSAASPEPVVTTTAEGPGYTFVGDINNCQSFANVSVDGNFGSTFVVDGSKMENVSFTTAGLTFKLC